MYARVTELQQILKAENENLENQKLEAECALSDLSNTDLLEALQRTVGYKMQMDISRETMTQLPYFWEKPHQPNLTGTPRAHQPVLKEGGADCTAWSPAATAEPERSSSGS